MSPDDSPAQPKRDASSLGIALPLHRFSESLVSPVKEIRIGSRLIGSRHIDALPMQSLEAVHQHGPVFFIKDIPAHLNHIIRCYSEEVLVKSGVMQFAQADPVTDNGLALGLSIRDDMRGFQEVAMA